MPAHNIMFRLNSLIKLVRFQSIFPKKKKDSRFTLPSDRPTQKEKEDIFHRNEKIAENISHAIRTSDGQMNFLISGDWGMGKTSILHAVENNLKSHDIIPFWFFPWRYSSNEEHASNIARAFLVRMAEKLGRKHEVKNLYLNRRIEIYRNIISQFIIWITLVANLVTFFLFLGGIIYLSSLVSIADKIPEFIKIPINNLFLEFQKIKDPDRKITIILTILGILSIPKLGEFFSSKIRQSADVEKETSPEQLEDTYKSILDRTIKWVELQKLISLWENTFEDTAFSFMGQPLTTKLLYNFLLKPFMIKKFVIFVDDLDRCDETEIQQFLTGIKTFLEDERVYFILAADINQINDKLRKLNSYTSNKKEDPLEYLRKIIQVVCTVPYLDYEKIVNLIDETLKVCKAKNNNLVNIKRLANFCLGIPNPRKIKYYIRRLLFIINYYKDTDDAKKLTDADTTLLFKLIMLVDLDHELYKQCSKNITTYQDYEKSDLESLKDLKDETDKEKRNLSLKIITSAVYSGSAKIELAKAFELVESSEGEPKRSQEFFEFASSDPQKAINYLRGVDFDFDELIPALLGNSVQGLEKLIKYQQDKLANPDTQKPPELEEIKNNQLTSILVIQDYFRSDKASFLEENFTNPYFKKLKELKSEIFYTELDKLVEIVLNLSRENLSAEKFMNESFEDDWFTKYSNLTSTIDKVGFNKITSASLYNKIVKKIINFIENHTADVIARLSSQIENSNVQENILDQYKKYYGNTEHQDIQLGLFDLLLQNSDKKFPKVRRDFIAFINEKLDVINAEKTMVKFKKEWQVKAKIFFSLIPDDSDPVAILNLFKVMWPNYILEFDLINEQFLKKLETVISKSDQACQVSYCDLLYTMKKSNVELIKKVRKSRKKYVDFLKRLKKIIKNSSINNRLTRSIKRLGGE
jgi:hypothetical protein